ncbi:MAG TPA: SDR family oxidoreductase [Burkholderiaceae bacterium]|nr:SDR family oxidoreductase [Burkholderiaceae bacterium]
MKDKCFLVTGATRGIGWAISQRLADEGAHVVGIARHVHDIDFPGYVHACDLSNAGETEEQLRLIREKYPIDGVVNNVGLVRPGPIEELDLGALYEVFDVNVRVAAQVVKTFAPGMKARREGRIINIGSRTAQGAVDRSSYSAAKAALNGLTRTWALELAPHGITVNTVAPGPVDTELFRVNHPHGSAAEKAALAGIPLGRFAQPADVAAAVVFLLREEAGFITGQVLGVDGGGTIAGR